MTAGGGLQTVREQQREEKTQTERNEIQARQEENSGWRRMFLNISAESLKKLKLCLICDRDWHTGPSVNIY